MKLNFARPGVIIDRFEEADAVMSALDIVGESIEGGSVPASDSFPHDEFRDYVQARIDTEGEVLRSPIPLDPFLAAWTHSILSFAAINHTDPVVRIRSDSVHRRLGSHIQQSVRLHKPQNSLRN